MFLTNIDKTEIVAYKCTHEFRSFFAFEHKRSNTGERFRYRPMVYQAPGKRTEAMDENHKGERMKKYGFVLLLLLVGTVSAKTKPCKCAGWEYIKVSAAGEGTRLVKCGPSARDYPWRTNAGNDIFVSARYNCEQPTCPVYYRWVVTNAETGEEITTTPVCTWPPGSSDGNFGFTLSISEGSMRINLTAYCGENACDSCSFRVCPKYCRCGVWDSTTVEWHSPDLDKHQRTIQSDDTLTIGELAQDEAPPQNSTEVVIIPYHQCEASIPCEVTYQWNIVGLCKNKKFEENGICTDKFSFTLPKGFKNCDGWYDLTITPTCAGKECSPKTVRLYIGKFKLPPG